MYDSFTSHRHIGMTSQHKRGTVKSNGWGGAGRKTRYRETILTMLWRLGHRRRSIAQQTKRTTATSEDEVEHSLRLALLAGKVEALGQSSQSKCESSRLKGHFPSSSPVWKGATQHQCQQSAGLYFRDNTDKAVTRRLFSLRKHKHPEWTRLDTSTGSNKRRLQTGSGGRCSAKPLRRSLLSSIVMVSGNVMHKFWGVKGKC